MYDVHKTVAIIKSEARKKCIPITEMLSNLGLSKNALSSMSSRGSWISSDSLARIADYLGVSVDYLLGRDTPDEEISDSAEDSMIWERFYAACKERGTSPTAVCLEIGLSNAAATGWKNGNQPKADILARLARHLGVSVDYLLGIDNPAPADSQSGDIIVLKGTRDEWVTLLSQMTDEQLLQLRDYAEFLIAKNKEGNK